MTYNTLQMNDKFIIINFIIVIAYKSQQPAIKYEEKKVMFK